MAARESQHQGLPVLDFFSADRGSRGEAMGRDSPAFQQPPKPPPPISLSLRTRESSALALKHIFDQIYSSAESNPSNNDNSSSLALEKRNTELHVPSRDVSNAGFQGGRNQVSPSGLKINSTPEEHRSYKPDIESSFLKVQPQVFAANVSNPGSLSLSPALVNGGNLPVMQTSLHQTVSRHSFSSPSLKQPTSQLTIFYAGTVNVYDEVPADKANAIMLLAGTGNSWSTKPVCEGEKEQIPSKLSSPSLPLHMGMTSPMAGGSADTKLASPTTGKTMGFCVPPAPTSMSNPLANTNSTPIPSSASSMANEVKPLAAPKRPQAGIELPHARKASLARFLEKRKDRVQVRPQEEVTPHGEEKGEIASRNERPSSPKKPCLTGSTSSPAFNKQ